MGGAVSLTAKPKLGHRVLGIIGIDTLHDAELNYDSAQMESWISAFRNDFEGTMSMGARSMFVNPDQDL